MNTDKELMERSDGQDLEYYVHFEGYNRRIDRWVHSKLIIRVG